VEATRRLRAADPSVSVIVLTTYADDRSVVNALQAGAVGYLTKDAGAAEIRQALERVQNGQAVIDPAVQRHLVEAIAASAPDGSPVSAGTPGQGTQLAPTPSAVVLPDGLTPREAEVLGLMAAGLSNAEIAGAALRLRSHREEPHQPPAAQDRRS
jgi:DNA-binding NarL/FixJ family response regulator